jgi:hypothetical protein
VVVVELDPEHRVGEGLDHLAVQLDDLFLLVGGFLGLNLAAARASTWWTPGSLPSDAQSS